VKLQFMALVSGLRWSSTGLQSLLKICPQSQIQLILFVRKGVEDQITQLCCLQPPKMSQHIGTRFWFLKNVIFLNETLDLFSLLVIQLFMLFSSFADYILLLWSYRGNTRSNYRRFCEDLPERGESTLSEYSLGMLVSFYQMSIIILGFYPIRW
jgi:hypothetical protein